MTDKKTIAIDLDGTIAEFDVLKKCYFELLDRGVIREVGTDAGY